MLDSQAAMRDIVRVSQERNATHGITGALAGTPDYYVQILEGEADPVHEIMASIERDNRHTDVVILEESIISERSFSSWSMAFCGDSASVAGQIEAILLAQSPPDPLMVYRLRRLLIGLASGIRSAN